MIHIGLFEGIGGFSLAAKWMGWRTLATCEIADFPRKVLQYYWPEAYHHTDIHTLSYETINTELSKRFGSHWRSDGIILTGGFPCQDASIAKQHGNGQQGLDGNRTGLWRQMVRAIEECKPKYVVAENVENILRTNNGRDFATILGELVRMGFNCEWRVCRASEVGGCHHRSRVYLVAYSNSIGIVEGKSFFPYVVEEVSQRRRSIDGTTSSVGISWTAEPPVSFVDDGLSKRLHGITFSKWRTESIKATGNSIVPQVALQIFKAIEQYEKQLIS